jgi:hypothetical protein
VGRPVALQMAQKSMPRGQKKQDFETFRSTKKPADRDFHGFDDAFAALTKN